MKKLFILILIILQQFFHPWSYADLANPPKIESVTVDSSRLYKAGDEIAIDIAFSGGNPGLSRTNLGLYIEDQIDNGGYTCISYENWSSSSAGNYLKSDYGIFKPGTLRLYGTVTSNCFQGMNNFFGFLYLYDKADLQAYAANWKFSINVSDGKRIRVGIQLPEKKDSSFNVNSIADKIVLEGKSTFLELPKRTAEDVLLAWGSYPEDVCKITRDFAGQWSNKVEFLKTGTCNISGQFTLSRSEFNNKAYYKEIVVLSAAEKAAIDKLADLEAEKAASERKAAEQAAGESIRQNQKISVSPIPNSSVVFSSLGIPVKVFAESKLPVFAYNSTNYTCEYTNSKIVLKAVGRCVIAFSQEGNSFYNPAENIVIEFKILSSSKTSVTCTKGKSNKKVISTKPKCPVGYKLVKPAN